MQIAGIQKTTLVDFPGHVAATIFTRGCNFRCAYCHNPELVVPNRFAPLLPETEILQFLHNRRGKLDGVCITGGEPTLHADLLPFMQHIKALGFLVKLDTNGSNPDRLQHIIDSGVVDYIAMDIKSPLNRYLDVNHARGHRSTSLVHIIEQSITMIMTSGIDYEFRTTVTKPLLDLPDIVGIGLSIKGAKRHFLQNYVPSKQINTEQKLWPFNDQELRDAQSTMARYVEYAGVR